MRTPRGGHFQFCSQSGATNATAKGFREVMHSAGDRENFVNFREVGISTSCYSRSGVRFMFYGKPGETFACLMGLLPVR